jgi:hypothetical protein
MNSRPTAFRLLLLFQKRRYLNREFQERLQHSRLRSDVFVRPLTVINIQDLESIVHSAEGGNFDFIYALHDRTIRDERLLSDLIDTLR